LLLFPARGLATEEFARRTGKECAASHGMLKLAPHGEDRVRQLPVVGKLLEEGAPWKKPPHLKAFYFMTSLNLFLVFAVLLIIAMWRWW
jgi:hypothetical protein